MTTTAYNANTNTGLQTMDAASNVVNGVASGAGIAVKKQTIELSKLGLNETDHGQEVRRLAEAIVRQSDFDANTYGAVGNDQAAQTKSNQILDAVAVSDVGTSEKRIMDIIQLTKGFSSATITAGRPGLLARIVGKGKRAIENQREKYHSVSERVGAIAEDLQGEANELQKHNAILAELKKTNQEEFHATALRIAAGQLALNMMIDEAGAIDEDGKPLGYTYHTAQRLHALEKRLHDLQLTQVSRTQLAPQYDMLINNNLQLIDKYASVGSLMIPAWRNGITMALSIQRSEQSANVLNAVTDATNEYMRANSKMLKTANINVAKLSQRSVIDISTLQTIQADLEEGVRGVMEEQRTGATRRIEEMRQLQTLQNNLNKLARTEVKHLVDRNVATAQGDDQIEKLVKSESTN